jgi:hypothetical protein
MRQVLHGLCSISYSPDELRSRCLKGILAFGRAVATIFLVLVLRPQDAKPAPNIVEYLAAAGDHRDIHCDYTQQPTGQWRSAMGRGQG